MSIEPGRPEIAIRFRGSITEKQFALLQRSITPWWMAPYMTIPVFWYLFIFSGKDLAEFAKNPMAALSDVIALGVLFLLVWCLSVFGRRLAWRKNQELQPEVHGAATDTGIEWNAAFTTTRFPWNKFVRVKSFPDLVLVFYSWNCAFYLPRQFFSSEDQWNALKVLLTEKVRKH